VVLLSGNVPILPIAR